MMDNFARGLNRSLFRGAARRLVLLVLVWAATALGLLGCSGSDEPHSSETSYSTGYTIYLSLSKEAIADNDTDSAQINAEVRYRGASQAGVKVSLASSGGRLAASSATTGANGKVSVAITSGTTAGNQTITITATIDGASTSVPLRISGGDDTSPENNFSIYLSASKSAILPNDSDSALITATVLDGSVGQAAVQVSFSATGGRLAAASALTDASGKASVAISSGPLLGNQAITITAAIDGASISIPVQIIGGNLSIYLAAAKASILADDSDSALMTATVLNGSVGQAGIQVAFATTGGRLSAASAVTDGQGKASVAVTSGPKAANQTVTVTAAIAGATASAPLQITGADNLTVGPLTLGVNPLSAYGTTAVSVNVLNNGAPYTTPVAVRFSSPCATAGKASLSNSVSTVNGVATASYVDNGCAGSDIISASLSDGPTQSATLAVTSPDSGALTFVSATPATITLRGTGGAGTSEFSRLLFKVVDSAGNPIGGKSVSFALNTEVGGITLSTLTAISDATTGQVAVDVQAGVVGTPVRVTATTLTDGGVLLATQSSNLVISTGFPDQDSSSLSTEIFNIEGRDFDGITTNLTMRLADHFNNPVPDGTAVFFTTEGGSITPSCTTTAGACTVTLTSQNPRPADGRVTVLAYAIGEESFRDLDGDGLADLEPNEMVADMAEAWLDADRNGTRESSEPFIDFNNNGLFDAPDGVFNANLCNETPDPITPGRVSSPGSCGARNTIHVRRDTEIVFSGSYAQVSPTAATLPGCAVIGEVLLTVVDEIGNPMPAGTTVELSASGDIAFRATGEGTEIALDTKESFVVVNANRNVDNLTSFSFPLESSKGSTCASGDHGSIEVIVTTPAGIISRENIAVSLL